jgi:hypothetical protein
MSEEAKGFWSRVLKLVPVIALLVAIASFSLTLAFRKKELSCAYLGTVKLVNVDVSSIDPQVRMLYRDESVQSLSQMSFRLRNTGFSSIKSEDVRKPIRLTFPEGVVILSAGIQRTAPQEFAFAAKRDGQSVMLEFSLLNAGDEAVFYVYIINSEPRIPSFRGRIVDVQQLLFLDSSGGSSEQQATPSEVGFLVRSHSFRTVLYWVLILFNGFWAVLFSIVALAVPVLFVTSLVWRIKWGRRYAVAYAEFERISPKSEDEKPPSKEELEEEREAESFRLHAHPPLEPRHVRRRSRALNAFMHKQGIPRKPDASIDSLWTLAAGGIAFGGLAAICWIDVFLVRLVLR